MAFAHHSALRLLCAFGDRVRSRKRPRSVRRARVAGADEDEEEAELAAEQVKCAPVRFCALTSYRALWIVRLLTSDRVRSCALLCALCVG